MEEASAVDGGLGISIGFHLLLAYPEVDPAAVPSKGRVCARWLPGRSCTTRLRRGQADLEAATSTSTVTGGVDYCCMSREKRVLVFVVCGGCICGG